MVEQNNSNVEKTNIGLIPNIFYIFSFALSIVCGYIIPFGRSSDAETFSFPAMLISLIILVLISYTILKVFKLLKEQNELLRENLRNKKDD